MLNITAALGRNGWQDWIIQRVSAVFLGLYTIFLMSFWLFNGSDYSAWKALFNVPFVCYFTLAVVFALIAHAWIGLWIVCTDYIKSSGIRLLVLACIYCFLLFDLIWCIQILWGY